MSGEYRIGLNFRPLAKASTSERRAIAVAETRSHFARLRARLGWSRERTAEYLGVAVNSVERWETTNARYAREVPAWAIRALENLFAEGRSA